MVTASKLWFQDHRTRALTKVTISITKWIYMCRRVLKCTTSNAWQIRCFQSLDYRAQYIKVGHTDNKHYRVHKVNVQLKMVCFSICDSILYNLRSETTWLVILAFDQLIVGSPSYERSGSCHCT
jgi:hypothetical protein